MDGCGEGKAMEHALRLLAVRDRSSRELEERLAGKGFSPEAAAAVVARLREAGLVDDGRFARQWAIQRLGSGAGGPARVRFELARKGISRDIADRALEEAMEGRGEAQLALLAVEGRARRRAPRGHDDLRRLQHNLLRRGFSSDAALEAVLTLGRHFRGETGPQARGCRTEAPFLDTPPKSG